MWMQTYLSLDLSLDPVQLERGNRCNIVAIEPAILAKNIEVAQESAGAHPILRKSIDECMNMDQFVEDQETALRMVRCTGVKVAGERRARVTLDRVAGTNKMQISRHTHVMADSKDSKKTLDLQLLAFWYNDILVLVTPLHWTPRSTKTGGLWPYLATSKEGSPALACRLILALACLSWPAEWQNMLAGM
jgi:hypothetical protein